MYSVLYSPNPGPCRTSMMDESCWWQQDAADIEKWRADRRKRYPTETNVKKREIADEDREVRGQVASTPMYRVGKGGVREPRASSLPCVYTPPLLRDEPATRSHRLTECRHCGSRTGHYRDGKRQKRAPAAGDDVSEPVVDDTPSAQGAVEATASAPSLSSGGGLGLVSYSSSSEDEDNDAPSVASSSVPLSGPRIVVPPLSPSEVEAAAAARAAKGGREKNIATAEEKLAELEQSMEDPLKRLKAGKYKSSLLERVSFVGGFSLYRPIRRPHLSSAHRDAHSPLQHSRVVCSSWRRRFVGNGTSCCSAFVTLFATISSRRSSDTTLPMGHL
jgi:hypothetical protein